MFLLDHKMNIEAPVLFIVHNVITIGFLRHLKYMYQTYSVVDTYHFYMDPDPDIMFLYYRFMVS